MVRRAAKLAPAPAEMPKAAPPDRVLAFLQRRASLLAVALTIVATLRIASTYDELSLTYDEPGHIGVGIEFVFKHVYHYETQHPPLARAMAAIGPRLAGVHPMNMPREAEEGLAVVGTSKDPIATVRYARMGILPFFWICAWIIFVWMRRFGALEALASVFLFTLIPPILAHAGLATTDMAVTASVPAAILATINWAASTTWKNTLVLGAASAFAALTKISAVGYLPCSILACILVFLIFRWPGVAGIWPFMKAHAGKLGVAVAFGYLVLWAGYWFSFGAIPNTHWKVPAPEFFAGISDVLTHNSGGHAAYLLGSTSVKGWWYFFPIALGVKTPIALLLLSAGGLILSWRCRRNIQYLLPTASACGILGLAMAGHINIGVRHVLPIYPFFAMISSFAMVWLLRQWRVAAAVLVLWMAVTGARAHPDYLAYFNEFAGSDPEGILVDSDLDWGQELIWLSRRLTPLHLDKLYANFGNKLNGYNIYHLPPAVDVDLIDPPAGWVVISPTFAKHPDYRPVLTGLDYESLLRARERRTPWYERVDPVARVGALRLYHFPAGNTAGN